MIVGVGVDLVDLQRFEQSLASTPKLLERLFAESEREGNPQTLAGRFAAKEAFVKAVGNPLGMNWHDVFLTYDELGKPSLNTAGETDRLVKDAGIQRFHVSISHDGGKAIAFVVAEGGL
jgi:holo-[acyl-carrier protein] synthase